ncbi:MAG: ABC transporter ATP-binding protein [Chloroflexota bacterium]
MPFKAYWNLLIDYLRPQRLKVVWLTLLVLSGISLQLINPQILRYFIDTALTGETSASLMGIALLFLGLGLLNQVLNIAAAYFSTDIAWFATNALRNDLVTHCLKLDMSFHNEHLPGEMIERIDGDIGTLANFFSKFSIELAGGFLVLIGINVLMFVEDWRLGLAFLGMSIVALLLVNTVRGKASPYWGKAREARADMIGFLEERLGGIEDIRTAGAISYTMRRFYQVAQIFFHKDVQARLMSMGLAQTIDALFAIAYVGAFALGVYFFQAGAMTVGTIYLIMRYINILSDPLAGIMDQIDDLQRANASIKRIETLRNTSSKIQDGAGVLLDSGPMTIDYKDVSFKYTENMVLDTVSFQLKSGHILGLLGRTGSGKTTLTRLLFRLYDPTKGEICLNGVNIKEASLAQLRQRIGVVTQNVQLFRGTVRDNVTFFDETIADEKIIAAIQSLGLSRWYESLPQGLDTELTGADHLSAGEGQLLAFTRIFLRDPDLIILDEASSRLDRATEQLIERALDRLLVDRTGIIIAHRLSTVRRADDILILEDGAIAEHGPYQDLSQNTQSRFYGLLQTGLEEVLA